MSEQKTSFMAELDAWTDQVIIEPLTVRAAISGAEDLSAETARQVRYAIREKILESYKNGCKAGAGSVRREMSHAQAKAH